MIESAKQPQTHHHETASGSAGCRARPRLLFLGNRFHFENTGSHRFLAECFAREFDVVTVPANRVWDRRIRRQRWHAAISFQMLLPPEEYRALGIRRYLLVPMHDSAAKRVEAWRPYGDFTFLSFCDALGDFLEQAGAAVWRTRYFPPPRPAPSAPGTPASIFFWERIPQISWPFVREIARASGIRRIHLHRVADPGFTPSPISPEDERAFDITTSQWFDDPAAADRIVSEHGVFIAPRIEEGIGMSFLKAMAMGRCVVAADRPTMNEYITHGENGVLFEPGRPPRLDLEALPELGRRAHASIAAGHRTWSAFSTALPGRLAEIRPIPHRPDWRLACRGVIRARLATLRAAVRRYQNRPRRSLSH